MIHAVSGIYRLGIDFVTRRVVIDSTVAKLQVWDGNALGQGTAPHLAFVSIFSLSLSLYHVDCLVPIAALLRGSQQ